MRAKIFRLFAIALAGLITGVGAIVPAGPSVSPARASEGPALTAPQNSTATPNQSHDPGDFVISGFGVSDSLLVSIGFLEAPLGTKFSIGTTTGLQPAAGYSGTTWTNLDRISFIATQANANTALASLSVLAGNTLGDFQVRVSATLNEAGVVYNPKNDHFYKYVKYTNITDWPTANRTWSVANTEATKAANNVKGRTGYLATITSKEESDFIGTNVTSDEKIWVGGRQFTAGAGHEWRWVGGPEAGSVFWKSANSGLDTHAVAGAYENWCLGTDGKRKEPNGLDEESLVIRWGGTTDPSCWNDWAGSNTTGSGFIIEYDAEGGGQSYTGVFSALTTITVNFPITNPLATRGNAQATVSWSAPSSGTVSKYTVTSSPGGKTCETTLTSCTVVGLTNGTSYSFSIVATFSGESATSVATTASVTPIDSAPSLTGPAAVAAISGEAQTLGAFGIADPFTCGWGEMTATVATSQGALAATASAGAVVSNNNTSTLTIRGSRSAVEQTLSNVSITSTSSGQNVTVTTSVVPSVDFTAPDGNRYHLNAATGHYYRVLSNEAISAGTGATLSAKAANVARGLSFCGFAGYLAAIDDSAEQTFIETSGAFDTFNPKISMYTSGVKVDVNGVLNINGVWKWRPGNGAPSGVYPLNFYNQGAGDQQGNPPWQSGEPNNSGTLHVFWFTNNRYGWDDVTDDRPGYGALVEFGATTSFSAPEVTTVVSVAAGAPAQLAVATQVVAGATGDLLTTQPVIEVKDAEGVLSADFNGTVTVSIHAGSGGSLSGNTTVNAVAGVATFTDLSLSGLVGEAYVLRFAAGALSVDSQVIQLSAKVTAPANHVVSFTDSLQAFSVSGLTSVQVTVRLSGDLAEDVSLLVPLASRTGLTLASGITTWEGKELSFRGSQTAVNAALASMIMSSSQTGTVTITVEAVDVSSGNVVNYFPGNGSFYEYVQQSRISYSDAKAAAATKTFAGRTGHLVTITSQAEQDFVSGRISGATNIWIAATDAGKEGVWYWDAGPELDKVFWRSSQACVTFSGDGTLKSQYTSTCVVGSSYSSSGVAVSTFNFAKWCSSEPNNSDGSRGEHHAVTNWGGGSCWNDLNGDNTSQIGGYVVEYSDPSGGGGGGGGSGVASASTTVTVGNKISIVTGNNQSAEVGSATGVAPSVKVVDGNNDPVAGAEVLFSVVTGGGSVSPSTAIRTDANGIATVSSWTLGTATGAQTLRARISGSGGLVSSVTFSATATVGQATQLVLNAGNNQSRVSGQALSTAPSVVVRDAFGNPVAGVPVSFAVVSGGGTVSPQTSVLTNAQGVASVSSWVLGSSAGVNTLSATAEGLTGSPVVFTATGTVGPASQLVLITQPVLGQTGALFATQPVVQIRDAQGNLVTTSTATVSVAIFSGTNGTLSGLVDVSAVGGVVTFTDLRLAGTLGEPYVLRFTSGALSAASSSSVTVAPPPPPPPPAPAVVPLVTPPQVAPTTPREPLLQSLTQPSNGPVLRNNVAPTPPARPTANINGVPTTVSTQVPNSNSVNIQTGAVNLGLNVQNGQGGVRQGTGGATELQVTNGGQAALQGSGLQAGSLVQVFMPMQGNNSKELARIPVDANGGFSGDVLFGTRPQESQLPIGRNVLQIVSVDDQGRQAVVEMTVNVAQPPPAPQINRVEQLLPALTPGVSLATQDGFPVPVIVRALTTEGAAVVEGEGWSMAVNVGSSGEVEPSGDGAVLKFVRNQEAVISGSGFMPGTRADIWLFSNPVLLGSVIIGDDGSFQGSVNIDAFVVPVGEHTLQLQGVGIDGYILAANLGVAVSDPTEGAFGAANPETQWLLWLVLGMVILGGAAVATRRLVWRRKVSAE